jgi:SAM-dependent methyltransferase
VLSALAARLRRGYAAGIDPSEWMVRHARARNRRWLAAGRAEIRTGGSGDLGAFADGRFDRVFGTHVVYFWSEPWRDLAEIRRVLRPGGRLLLGFFPDADRAGSRTCFSEQRVVALLGEAGFREIRAQRRSAGSETLAWIQGDRT